MPVDALRSLQALTQQLGRKPSLDELYRFVGKQVGLPVPAAPEGPVQDRDTDGPALLREVNGEIGPDPTTALLRHNELLALNPELRDMRDRLLRELLFGFELGRGEDDPFRLGSPGSAGGGQGDGGSGVQHPGGGIPLDTGEDPGLGGMVSMPGTASMTGFASRPSRVRFS